MDSTRPIAIVSFGAARWIHFRENATRNVDRVLLEAGSVLLMAAGMQQTHQHKIPKHEWPCDPRVSLTFRGLV